MSLKFEVPTFPVKSQLATKDASGGYTVWLALICNHLLAFGSAVLATFKNKLSKAPREPSPGDLRPETRPAPVPPSLDHRLFTPTPSSPAADDHPPAGGGGAPAAPPAGPSDVFRSKFLYDRDAEGYLSAAGLVKFDLDCATYAKDKKDHDQAQAAAFQFIFSTLDDSVKTALSVIPTWSDVRDNADLLGLRLLLDSIFVNNTTSHSTVSVKLLHSLIQTEKQSAADYVKQYRDVMENVLGVFGSVEHPGTIDPNKLGISCFLAGIHPNHQGFVEKFSDLQPNIATVKDSTACDQFLYWSQQQANIRASRSGSNTNTNSNNNSNNNNNSKKAAGTPTVGSFAAPVGGGRIKIPIDSSLFTATNPFSRARGDGTGNTAKPHCAHCILNGHVYGHSTDECHDLKKYRSDIAKSPTAVFTPVTASVAATVTAESQATALRANISSTPDASLVAAATEAGGAIDFNLYN